MIRLAVPLHLLFKAFEDDEKENTDDKGAEKSDKEDGGTEDDADNGETACATDGDSPADGTNDSWTEIDRSAIQAAQSIVKTCLQHVCE